MKEMCHETDCIAGSESSGIAAWRRGMGRESKEDEAKEHADAKKAVVKAKITLREAVEIALKKVPGGKAVEAELETEDDGIEYEVEVIVGGKHMEIEIDPTTGAVKEAKEEKAEEGEDEKAEEAAAKAPITLLQAIDAAQKSVPGGKAFEAEAEMENGKLIFEVEFVAGDKIMEVEVDATSGEVLEVKEEK